MIKFIFDDNGTLSDYSVQANNYFSGTPTINYTLSQDNIFIGSRFPFNHLYFKFGTANTTSSVLTVSIWDGSQFRNAVELYDETSTGGASFGQDGYITWTPDRNYSWGREDTVTSGGTEQVTGLGDLTIYDHYWVKLSFSASLDAGTTLSWCGNRFTDDNDLGTEFPDLVRSNTLSAWESGKTTWEEQHIHAATMIIQELKDTKAIVHPGQILDRKDFIPASIMKVAEIAFRAMGTEFERDRIDAYNNYRERISKAIAKIDTDQDGYIDREELQWAQGILTRGNTGVSRGFN